MSTHSSPPNQPAVQDGQTEMQVAIMQERNRHLRLDDPSTLLPTPASQEELEDVRRALTETAHNAGIHGLGAFGTVYGLRLSVRWQEIAFNPLNPREDLFSERPDVSMETLCKSLSGPYGQITDIQVTPLLPDDPDAAKGYRWRVIKGSRLLRAFQLLRKKNPCHIQEVLNREGLPLTRYEQLAYYAIAHVSQKPLSLPEMIRHLATTLFVFDEEVNAEETSLQLPSAETLAAHWAVSRATVYRALQIVRYEPKIIVYAVAQRQIPAQAIFELPRLVPDERRREALVRDLLAQQQAAGEHAKTPLTVEQVLQFARNQLTATGFTAPALPPAPETVVDAVPALPGLAAPPDSHFTRLLQIQPQATVKAQCAAHLLDALSLFEQLTAPEQDELPHEFTRSVEVLNREDHRTLLRRWEGSLPG